MFVLHGILITIYSVSWIVMVQKANNSNLIECKELSCYPENNVLTPIAPARPAVKDVQTVFTFEGPESDNYFGSQPTLEIDRRWNAIANGTYGIGGFVDKLIRTVSNFRFSEDEMTRWGRIDEGVRLSDGSGYLGTLNVFHEMHCLVRSINADGDIANS